MTTKLQRDGHMEQYDKVIREQRQKGIIQEAAETTTNQEFYLPPKDVLTIESFPLDIVRRPKSSEKSSKKLDIGIPFLVLA